MSARELLIAIIGTCLSRAGAAAAAINVTDWNLATGVQNFSGDPLQVVDFSIVVENPFIATQHAQLGAGTAATQYDIHWSGDNAAFRMDAWHVSPDVGNILSASLSVGDIYFTTTEPLIGRVVGLYTYSLPSFDMSALFGVGITDLRNNQFVLQSGGSASTLLDPWPLNGTLNIDQTFTVPANCDCLLQYTLALENHRNSGTLSTGQGYALITFQPVPEPGALALVVGGIPLMRRTRSRRCPRRPTRTAPSQICLHDPSLASDRVRLLIRTPAVHLSNRTAILDIRRAAQARSGLGPPSPEQSDREAFRQAG